MNYWQVKKSSRIYAISEIETEGNLALKGAKGKAIGWSVQMAIDVGKPVHLYDRILHYTIDVPSADSNFCLTLRRKTAFPLVVRVRSWRLRWQTQSWPIPLLLLS